MLRKPEGSKQQKWFDSNVCAFLVWFTAVSRSYLWHTGWQVRNSVCHRCWSQHIRTSLGRIPRFVRFAALLHSGREHEAEKDNYDDNTSIKQLPLNRTLGLVLSTNWNISAKGTAIWLQLYWEATSAGMPRIGEVRIDLTSLCKLSSWKLGVEMFPLKMSNAVFHSLGPMHHGKAISALKMDFTVDSRCILWFCRSGVISRCLGRSVSRVSRISPYKLSRISCTGKRV